MTASAFPLFPAGTLPESLWLNGEFVPWHDSTVHVTAMGDTVIDTHIGPTPDPVWKLFEYTLRKLKRLPPTLIEWDQDIPPLSVMLDEVAKARAIATRVLSL